MIRTSFVCVAFSAVFLFSAVTGPARAADVHKARADMEAILKDLGRSASDFTSLKTDFVQEKEMAMFKEKLVMKGRIYLQKPNNVAWHVDSPVRYSVLITDKLIRQWDEDTNKVQEISLVKNPVFQNLLNQMTVWFSGDYVSLLAVNDVRRIQEDPIVLEFTPTGNNAVRKVIKSITLTFREDRKYLKQVRIREQSGDVTTLNFSNTVLNAPLDSSSFEVRRSKEHTSTAEPLFFADYHSAVIPVRPVPSA
jgi:outer membrane lipoprotein-sorting protein